jgi:hypothetical protein
MFDAPMYHTFNLGTEYEKIQLKNLIQEMVDPMADSNTGCKRYVLGPRDAMFLYDWLRDQKLHIIEAWANVNSPGSRNELHQHEKVQYTGVYFLTAPENCGSLVLKNPANVANQCHPDAPNVQDIVVEPVEGGMIVFPGWVPHEVWINNSTEDRISIAFNLGIVQDEL